MENSRLSSFAIFTAIAESVAVPGVLDQQPGDEIPGFWGDVSERLPLKLPGPGADVQ